MDITPLIPDGAPIVRGYAGGAFRIGTGHYPGAVALFPDGAAPWDFSGPAEGLSMEALAPILGRAQGLRILVLGTGARTVLIGPELRQDLRARGVVAECMDTGAACRTWNVLLAEGREAAAALLPFGG